MARLSLGTFLLSLVAVAPFAQTQILELFTSKFCPNCPAVERQLAKEAADNPNLILLQQHVDYWDRGAKKDPYGLAEATQRQYDYSNVILRRAGEVFTPMPIFNGKVVAAPPLWLSWAKAKAQAEELPAPKKLAATRTAAGLNVVLNPSKNLEAYAFGVSPMETTNALRATSIAPMEITDGRATLAPALAPKGQTLIVVQEAGMGRVVGWAIVP
jgi:hypothetical protein